MNGVMTTVVDLTDKPWCLREDGLWVDDTGEIGDYVLFSSEYYDLTEDSVEDESGKFVVVIATGEDEPLTFLFNEENRVGG